MRPVVLALLLVGAPGKGAVASPEQPPAYRVDERWADETKRAALDWPNVRGTCRIARPVEEIELAYGCGGTMRRGPARLASFAEKTLTLADVVVSVKGIAKGKDWPKAWSNKERQHDIHLTQDEQIEPRVHVARAATQLVFHNGSDAPCALHGYGVRAGRGLRSLTIFNFSLPPLAKAIESTEAFVREAGLVWMTDDMDSAKSAWVHVVDTPYVAGPTSVDGRYEIAYLPPGTYAIEAWHEAFTLKTVAREGGRPEYVRSHPIVLERQITIRPGQDVELDFTFPVP